MKYILRNEKESLRRHLCLAQFPSMQGGCELAVMRCMMGGCGEGEGNKKLIEWMQGVNGEIGPGVIEAIRNE